MDNSSPERPLAGSTLSDSFKFALLMQYCPQLVIAYLAGVSDFGKSQDEALQREILGRDAVLSRDVHYSCGRITEIGGKKVEAWTIDGSPSIVGGRKVKYGLFGTFLGLE